MQHFYDFSEMPLTVETIEVSIDTAISKE